MKASDDVVSRKVPIYKGVDDKFAHTYISVSPVRRKVTDRLCATANKWGRMGKEERKTLNLPAGDIE